MVINGPTPIISSMLAEVAPHRPMPRTRVPGCSGREVIGYDTDTVRGICVLALAALCAVAQSPLERAVTLAREKRYAEAKQLLEGAAEPAGLQQKIAFHRLKAAVAAGLGEGPRAAEEMHAALSLAPRDQNLLLATAAAEALAGDVHERSGEFVEAAKSYQAAVALAPDREQYRVALALEFVQHYTFEPAIAVLQEAAPRFPRSGRIRTLLGVAWYAVGRIEDAETALLDAITVEPRLDPAYSYLARIVLESPAAPPQPAFDALCGWNAGVCGALQLRAAREKDDRALAAQAIARLKRAPAEDAVAHCELGRAYEWLEQWGDARTETESCVKLDGSPQNHYRLGRIYARLGMADLARKEMALRSEAAERASEDVARRESAVQAFQVLK